MPAVESKELWLWRRGAGGVGGNVVNHLTLVLGIKPRSSGNAANALQPWLLVCFCFLVTCFALDPKPHLAQTDLELTA